MKSVELFAGAGGLALGLENAGFKNIMLNEKIRVRLKPYAIIDLSGM